MCVDPVDLEGLVFLVSFIHSGSYTFFFLPPILQGSFSPEVRNLMEIFHLGLKVLRSLILYGTSDCIHLYSHE